MPHPVTVIQYTGISCSEINAQSTRPGAKQKYSNIAVYIIEFLNLVMNVTNTPIQIEA